MSNLNNFSWFEFVLDSDLLENVLNQSSTEAGPFELVKRLLCLEQKSDFDSERYERDIPVNTKKGVAVRIFTMKILAFLNWNLDCLEPKLPSRVIMQILTDLMQMAGDDVNAETTYQDFTTMSHQTVFAVTMYHRWAIKALIHNTVAWKQQRFLFIAAQGGPDPNIAATKRREDLRLILESQVIVSVEVLKSILARVDGVIVPTLHSFIHPTDNNIDITPKWENGVRVSAQELKCQLNYELGQFLLFRRDHEGARAHFAACIALLEVLESKPNSRSSVKFCSVDKEELYGLSMACEVPGCALKSPANLKDRFDASIRNHYTGIIQILQTDNLLREIPVIDRDLVEVEVQVAMSSGTFTVAKDLLMKMQLLNALRRVMDRKNVSIDVTTVLRNGGEKALQFFLASIHSILFDVPAQNQTALVNFLIDLMLRDLVTFDSGEPLIASTLLADEAVRSQLKDEDIAILEKKSVHCQDGKLLITVKPIEDISPALVERSPRLEVMNIQQQLAQNYNTTSIKQMLQKLISTDPKRPWHRTNGRWDLPIPLQSVVMNLPEGMKQEYMYILLAKSRELCINKDYRKSILLLETSLKEAKVGHGISSGTLYKLNRLVEWEILLVQINQYLDEYPENTIDPGQLTASCKSCLAASHAGDSVIPRLEVLESCALALLNLGEWEVLTGMDKRWVYLELAAALAYACQDITKFKGTKKISRDAWDLILPVFGPATQKRSNTGATASPTGSGLTKSSLVRFLTQLREPTVLSAATSLLARLHNVLRDEPSLEINCLHAALWPAVVSNSNSYNSRFVAEMLAQVTTQALNFMPNHFPLLKILGDLNYVLLDWASALRYYLEAGAVASELYTQPVPKAVLDDFTYKRMIKCCVQLQCYTQAAVLCQCLDDVDYLNAFKWLTETKNLHCADATDAYYQCIWDITLLEFIANMHSKRGEIQRKTLVIKMLGLLELNSNNNEEIQREAANVRRNKLMRALLRQYSISCGAPFSSHGTIRKTMSTL